MDRDSPICMFDLERRSAWHECSLLDDLYNRYIKYGETNVCENIHFVRMRMILGTHSYPHTQASIKFSTMCSTT